MHICSRKKSVYFRSNMVFKSINRGFEEDFHRKTCFSKFPLTEKLERVLRVWRYQTKEEETVNKLEKKKCKKIGSYYKFEATLVTLCPVLERFFKNIYIVGVESPHRGISYWYIWKMTLFSIHLKNFKFRGGGIRGLRGRNRNLISWKIESNCSFVHDFRNLSCQDPEG